MKLDSNTSVNATKIALIEPMISGSTPHIGWIRQLQKRHAPTMIQIHHDYQNGYDSHLNDSDGYVPLS